LFVFGNLRKSLGAIVSNLKSYYMVTTDHCTVNKYL